MEFKFVLGVDMSKGWFNFCLMNAEFELLWEGQINNEPDAIFEFIAQLLELDYFDKLTDVLLCMEHTGIYVKHLVNCWLSKTGQLCLVHAPKVSQHLAGQHSWEEKTDQIDAQRLAEYAFRYRDKLKLWQAKDQTLAKLQSFQRQRQRLIQAINILEVPLKESIEFDEMDLSQSLILNQSNSLTALKVDLAKLEKTIKDLIESDDYLNGLFKLINSVEGVGPVTAREIIIATNAFTDFVPTQAKAFAKYTGVIPMKRQSGKSVRGKHKIGKRKHKKLKPLLTMGAQALINTQQELGFYYRRKKKEGKHHCSIINAMRNKIILRVFAVVRNQVMYQKNLNICLD